MAQMIDVTITAKDSPVPNALDQYYGFLRDLLPLGPDQRLALNSTLVTFDILPDTPLYNEYVYRAFADRTIMTSPSNFEPVALGAGNITNRYSYSMTELLRAVIAGIDARLSVADQDRIKLLERDIKAARKELETEYMEMVTRWGAYKTAAGLSDTDPLYLDKQTAFYNTFNFAEVIRQIRNEISDTVLKIDIIRDGAYPDSDARQLVLFMRHATQSQYQMTRPISPRLEHELHYDLQKIAQLWIYENLNYFETNVDVLPSGYLENFVTNLGERSFKILKGAKSTYEHDVDWSVSASGGWGFWKAKTETHYEQHIRDSIAKITSVEIGFKNLAEYWVRRGPWYSSTVFDMKRVIEQLAKHPKLAANLSQVISSVVLGRGMWVKYYFQDQQDYKYWDKISTSGSGGYSFLGMGAKGGAGYTESNVKTIFNNVEKSVTFQDSDEHCRLVGFKVENLIGPAAATLARYEGRQAWDDAIARGSAGGDVVTGRANLSQFDEKRDGDYLKLFAALRDKATRP